VERDVMIEAQKTGNSRVVGTSRVDDERKVDWARRESGS
jgi:hypothetical protein